MAIIMIPSTTIMLLAVTALVVWGQIDSRRYLLRDILSHAEMLADNCKHCIEPSCVSVCPSGALWKRSDGPVLYDVNRCIG